LSTYYYLACDRHKVVSRVIGGRSFPHRWWSNDEGELETFLEAHGDCKPLPVLISEHDARADDYTECSSEPDRTDPNKET
jgi:hypothetical protein